jgi:hypothetical protein
MNDKHKNGENLASREIVKEFEFRDVLSSRQDEKDPEIMHIWSFPKSKSKKCCGCSESNKLVRKLKVRDI